MADLPRLLAVFGIASALLLEACGNTSNDPATSPSVDPPATTARDTVATPTITPSGGSFPGSVSVTLACSSPGAQIRYTLDGSEPGPTSALYTGAFGLDSSRTVRAVGFKADWVRSREARAGFTVVPAGPLQVAPWNPSVAYSILQDPRDGKSYRTIRVGTSEWMAENLDNASTGACYGNSADSCAKYGRLYTWIQAMGLDDSCETKTCLPQRSPVRGICPVGWHVPGDSEWTALVTTVEASAGTGAGGAGKLLKSTEGWSAMNGTDAVGFRGLPAGVHAIAGLLPGSEFVQADSLGEWWSSTPLTATTAYVRYLTRTYSIAFRENILKGYGLSLRCAKDPD